MYVPKQYQSREHAWTRFVMRNHPLATLVTPGPRVPQATHVPVIFAPGSPQSGDVVGTTLLGHLNRANPHWRWLEDDMTAKLVFAGPHGYVTPVDYHTEPAAPTWNFVTVHVVGTLRRIEDLDGTLEVVRGTVLAYENDFGVGWNPESSLDYFRSIGRAVGAFQLRVEHVDAMFKLSQGQTPEQQDRIIARFEAADSGVRRDVGRIMREFGLGTAASVDVERPSVWGGAADPPCLLESLVDTAKQRPDEVAVVDDERELTYAELLGWAGDIAGLLRDRGVAAGDRVAVAGPRSAEVVAAMLGVLSVGATYVPLDSEYPARRLAHMLSDSAPKVLLHVGAAPEVTTGAAVVAIPEPRPGHAPDPSAWPVVACSADLPVYVIYTSGSTGRPKGVALPHSCVDNMVEWQRGHSRRPDPRTAQFAPLNFDVCFQEILGTLAGGGTLVIVPERLRSDPFELLDWLADNRIERLFLPYLGLHMLSVAAASEKSLAHLALREVNTAGEQIVCSPPIREFFTRLADCRLDNHYGQSESAMVTAHTLTGPPSQWPSQPPIGGPLPGCELLIDPVEPDDNTIGELLVAGAPLALGYLNQPELNARRYITIPPTPQGHTRAFRTGDLVRLDGDVVQYLSRLDHDVKIRGTRVNLLEVDACLLEQPGVAEAICVVVELSEGTRSLHAAVTAEPGLPPLDVAALLDALREVLPAVSVPVSLHVLPELPLTSSGKIDREAVVRQVAERIDQRSNAVGRHG
ncbi:amino acid adenylation domain-containing protein [Saccharothrix ecbatanensis]|uniref:Amino acid adenylation domain-containing protein n=1 Tax=Saccharothrix ecbatanensis TaxID=1105145 RepID=A0A7W9HNG9_9PSEU|nr:AMP-binding protein [Saccharothrix ecbatanensis]MBB5804999.1 amino acid adenylation domain-containing protein [Saccharothrix ecbatanensis]